MEEFILAKLDHGFHKFGEVPSRKLSLYYARDWNKMNSDQTFGNFKVSKGWCDKFMRRNKERFRKWLEPYENKYDTNFLDGESCSNFDLDSRVDLSSRAGFENYSGKMDQETFKSRYESEKKIQNELVVELKIDNGLDINLDIDPLIKAFGLIAKYCLENERLKKS